MLHVYMGINDEVYIRLIASLQRLILLQLGESKEYVYDSLS